METLTVERFELVPAAGSVVVGLSCLCANGMVLRVDQEVPADVTRSINWHAEQAAAAAKQRIADEKAIMDALPMPQPDAGVTVDVVLPAPTPEPEPEPIIPVEPVLNPPRKRSRKP